MLLAWGIVLRDQQRMAVGRTTGEAETPNPLFPDPNSRIQALPMALSPHRGREGAEFRSSGFWVETFTSPLAQGRHRSAPFHLRHLPKIPRASQNHHLLLQASYHLCFPIAGRDIGTMTSGPP